MSFNPSSISLAYRKYSGTVPNTLVELTFQLPADSDSIRFRSLPTWLSMITDDITIEDGKAVKALLRASINENYADTLSVGWHQNTIKVEYRVLFGVKVTEELRVSLKVMEEAKLTISKKTFNFSYTIGNTVPAGQFLNIFTPGSWSIAADQPWLSFTGSNGSGPGLVGLNVDPAGLAVGIYTATFIVDDGTNQQLGTVYLTISGTGNEEDYLNVNPSVLEFAETYQQPSQRETSIKVDSSLVASVTADVTWLEFSETDLAAGITSLVVSTVNTEVLPIGTYPAEIRITSAFGVAVVNVLLQIVEILTSGIENNGFYYSDDRNTLFLTNGSENAEAVLDIRTQATLEFKNYQRRIPFFRNSASVIIGMETNLLLRPQQLPELLVSHNYAPVIPIRMDFTVYDKTMGNAAMVERQRFENLQFLTGKSPKVPNVLTYIPSRITAPRDGVLAFNFINAVGAASVEITGAVQTSIPLTILNSSVYGVLVDLGSLALSAGNKITIVCGPISVEVAIKPTQLSTTHLIWLNQWNCPEILNLDGVLTKVDEDDSTTVVSSRAGKEYSSIIDVKDAKSWKVDTGNIYSAAEVEHLATILRSKKMWLQFGTERVEVIRTFKNISTFETRRAINNFTLTFDAAER